MDGKKRRPSKGKLRDVHPELTDDDEGSASASRIPPPPSQLPPKRIGGVPLPPSFGPPKAAPPIPARTAFEEAGPPPSQAPRKKRKSKRHRTSPLLGKTKAPAGLESDDSSEAEDSAKASTSASEVQETGFFQTLWQGAAAAIGVVSDIVTAINAETDSEDEKHTAGQEGSEEKAKGSTTLSKAEEEEQYIEYVSQFCMYLGVDVAAEPELITEVDDYLKRPLPQGWSTHLTGEDCEYGAGYSYFMNASTGKTQWTRPDEDDFLQHLRTKMKRKPTAGSRLFFAEFRDRNRREKWAALEDQIDHITGTRPLLRALPEGSPEPDSHPSRCEGIFHVVLYNRFPVMYPAVVEAFASYFGLGSLPKQFAAAELRHFWVAKIAALCPVPSGWEFKFDETSTTAVFVDQGAGTASRHHPMDAFFAGLLERLLSRHRSVEAAESQRLGQAVALGSQMVFFLDSLSGTPYWLQYGANAMAWNGPLPWKTSKPSKPSNPVPSREPRPREVAAPLKDPPVAIKEKAGPPIDDGLRDAAKATPKCVDPLDPLRAAAGGVGFTAVGASPRHLAPPTPGAPAPATPKVEVEEPTPRQALESEESARGDMVTQEEEEQEESRPEREEESAQAEEEAEIVADAADAPVPPAADTAVADAIAAELPSTERGTEAEEAVEMPSSAEIQEESAQAEEEAEIVADAADTPVPPAADTAAEPPVDDTIAAEPPVADAIAAEAPIDDAIAAEPSTKPDVLKPETGEATADDVPKAEDEEEPTEHEMPSKEASPRSQTLFSLAEQLQEVSSHDTETIIKLLEELENVPATVELLRQTQLGVISQPFKDHDDATVRKVAKRLRRSWKDLIAATANEAPVPPTEEVGEVSMPEKSAIPEAQHGMVPPEKELTVEEEADKLLKEMEEISTTLDSPKLQRKVGGTEDATDLFGTTPREPQLEHVGAPKHLFRPTSAVRRSSAVQDADEVFGKSPREPRETPLEHVGAPKHVSRPTSAQTRRPSLEEVLSGSKKGTFARAASLSLFSAAAPAPPKQLPAAPAPAPPKPGKTLERSPSAPKSLPPAPKPLSDQVKPEPQRPKEERTMPLKAPEPPTVEAPAPKPLAAEAAAPKPPMAEAAAPEPPMAEAAAPKPPTAEAAAPKPLTAEAVAPKPPMAEAAAPEPPEAPPTESLQTDEAATKAPSQPVEPKRVMALLPPAPLPPAPMPTTSAPPPPPKTGSPSRKKLSMAPLPPVTEIEAPAATPEISSDSSEELMPETPVAKHGKAAASGYPQISKGGDAPAAPVAPAGYPSREVPSRPTPQINAGLPQARRQRAELVSNLQYLCRLFLETREQLYAAHEGTETEANCDGLREELDAVRFRRLLEETLGQPHGTMPKPLIRLLRSFGRRALYGRRRSPYGRRSFALFQQACTGHEGRGFVLGAVPQVLRLMDRLVEEGRRTMSDAVEDGGDDPWLDGMPEEVPETKGKGLPDWERLDGILSETPNLESLHVEADAFLAETSMPKPLCLSKAAEAAEPEAAQPESGSFAPRGRRPAKVEGEDASTQDAKHGRRLFAPVAPYYSSDPALLLKVARAPLPNLDSLVNALVPGAEITTEGLLLQLADEELVVMAYALEQIAEAASKRLVKDLEVRDELRSTCMHRREYLQLLEGALSRK